jgi:hypothetical protein
MGASVEDLKELGALFEQAEQTPHHEAGHAVVMAWLKLPFVDLTLEEDAEGETAGQATLWPEACRRDYTDSAIGCAAGQAADNLHEELCGNPSFDWDNSNDNNQIRILGMLTECFTTDDQRGWFNYVRRHAGGEREIPAQEALRILRACKKASASGTVQGTAWLSQ